MFGNVKTRLLMVTVLINSLLAGAAQGGDLGRQVISKVNPSYPEIARQMRVTGTVRIEVVVAANGTVKELKAKGGHPLLIQAACEALHKWRFVPGAETTTIIEFHFRPADEGPRPGRSSHDDQ